MQNVSKRMDPSRWDFLLVGESIFGEQSSKAKRMRSTYYLLIKIEFVSLNIKIQYLYTL